MIRVLLVDDQELIRAGLRGILREQFGFQVVGECAHGGEVAAAARSFRPDVVLMDVRMPVLDGIEATRRLHSDREAPPVLALTTFDDDEVLAGGPDGEDEQLASLTAREREVLALIASGLTNDEIAEELVVTPGTVKTHVNHIFFKLDLRNRAEAVIFAFDHDLARRRGA